MKFLKKIADWLRKLVKTNEVPTPKFPESIPRPLPKPILVRGRRLGMTQKLSIEEMARKDWLPEPQSRRHRIPSHSRVPAADHTDAIAKCMGKHGKGHHPTYRRMTRKRTSKEELEEN